MKFEVIRTRKNGRLLMMFARAGHGKFVGELLVEQKFVRDLNRHSMVATLLDERSHPISGLEPLHDAVLTSAKPGYWTIAGFERIGIESMEDFCQSWIMTPMDKPRPAPEGPPILSSEEAARHVAELPAKIAFEKAGKAATKERAAIDRQWPPKPDQKP